MDILQQKVVYLHTVKLFTQILIVIEQVSYKCRRKYAQRVT